MKKQDQIVARVTEEIDKLPPIPTNIIDLRRVAADPNVEFSKIVPLLNKDPGMAANLLKFANSARYGVSHKIDSIEEAILYFGMSNLMEFIAVSFADGVMKKSFSRLHGVDSYFDHSREISAQCRTIAIAANMSRHDQETYALVGLLHDIGKLILTIASDKQAYPLISASVNKMTEVVNSEKDLWGIDHCEVGAQICKKWKFPDIFETSIKRHHTPLIKPNDDFCPESAMIFLSHILTIDSLSPEIIDSALPKDKLLLLNLTSEKLAEVARKKD